MTDIEKRAHDLAVSTVQNYILIENFKQIRNLQMLQIDKRMADKIDPDKYPEEINIYQIYKNSYSQFLESLTRDFS